MENYFYNCSCCSYVHLVPAYWMDFSPESEYEFEHVNPDTGEMCTCTVLTLQTEAGF